MTNSFAVFDAGELRDFDDYDDDTDKASHYAVAQAKFLRSESLERNPNRLLKSLFSTRSEHVAKRPRPNGKPDESWLECLRGVHGMQPVYGQEIK